MRYILKSWFHQHLDRILEVIYYVALGQKHGALDPGRNFQLFEVDIPILTL